MGFVTDLTGLGGIAGYSLSAQGAMQQQSSNAEWAVRQMAAMQNARPQSAEDLAFWAARNQVAELRGQSSVDWIWWGWFAAMAVGLALRALIPV